MRYYYNLRYKAGADGLAIDPDGDELAVTQVREHALTMARDLIARTRLDSIANWFDCTFEIMDEENRPLMTVPFTDTVPDDDGD